MTAVHLSSEVAPFSKTGGLADVAAALPEALAQAGIDAVVISPFYPSVARTAAPEPVRAFPVTVGSKTTTIRLLELERRRVRHIFIDEPGSFNRPYLYGDRAGDFPDNAERFVLFCRGALLALVELGIRPDVVHCHDWQTALVPFLLKEHFARQPALSRARTVLTVHNLGYQGNFPKDRLALLEVPDRLFAPDGLEFYGSVSFLKAGLVFADRLTTVSPTYSKEIQTPELGFGLDGVLRARASDLSGILNGIDTEVWNPATDPHLSRTFDAGSLDAKRANKAGLCRELALRPDDSPLFGSVTRLAGQKGIDKVIAWIPDLVSAGARIVILGTGSAEYENELRTLAQRYPDSVSVTVGFSERLAHRIYGSSDFFLMPSEYEPCGLGQMISLRYGTLPIAARTGGLADTIVDLDQSPDAGTGFLFTRGSTREFGAKLRSALALYGNAAAFRRVQRRAMARDFSWTTRCREYIRLYRTLVAGNSESAG